MSKVYITQSPVRRAPGGDLVNAFDLTPAREYGDLVVLLPAGPTLVDPELACEQLWSKLRDFNATDKLLCLGDPVAIAAASAIVAQVNGGVVPLLVWDRRIKRYISPTLDTNYAARKATPSPR